MLGLAILDVAQAVYRGELIVRPFSVRFLQLFWLSCRQVTSSHLDTSHVTIMAAEQPSSASSDITMYVPTHPFAS